EWDWQLLFRQQRKYVHEPSPGVGNLPQWPRGPPGAAGNTGDPRRNRNARFDGPSRVAGTPGTARTAGSSRVDRSDWRPGTSWTCWHSRRKLAGIPGGSLAVVSQVFSGWDRAAVRGI